LDEDVAPRRHGIRKLDIDERRFVGDRTWRPISDGFHEGLQDLFLWGVFDLFVERIGRIFYLDR